MGVDVDLKSIRLWVSSIVFFASFALQPGMALAAPAVPIGVDLSPPLPAGKMRLSYQIEATGRKGYRKGDSRRSVSDLTQYSDVPRRIERQEHVFAFDVAPWKRLTISVQLPFVHSKMNITRKSPDPGKNYSNNSSGLGDVRIAFMVPFMKKGTERLYFHAELTAPTGRIDERGRIRSSLARDLLPFSMQPGSGSWGLGPGFNYQGHNDVLGWGLAGSGFFYVDKNDQGYRLGNHYEVTGWLSRELIAGFSGSLRLSWDQTDSANGRSIVGPASNPDSEAHNQGGGHLELGPGISLVVPLLGEQRISIEAAWPLYQDLNGTQLERDWTLRAGLSWMF